MRKSVALLVAIAAAVAPDVAQAGDTHSCGQVSFAPQSENGAFQIMAYRETCATARYVAGRSRPGRFRQPDRGYLARGYHCYGSPGTVGVKPVVSYDCFKGDSHEIAFARA